MSADNGIYILKMKDEYRVCHRQAVEDLYYNWFTKAETTELNWPEVYLTYKNCKSFNTITEALNYANEWSQDFYILEYGVSILSEAEYFTWKQIHQMAYEDAQKEIMHLKQHPYASHWEWHIKSLETIIHPEALCKT